MSGGLQNLLHRVRRRFRRSEQTALVMLALAIGMAGGMGAVLFRYLIRAGKSLFFDGGAWAFAAWGDYYVIALPAIGLVIVSFIVNRWAPEAKGHGVPEVMYAVNKKGGRIRPRVVVIKALASAICIGSGGSVGREGPIVQIGSTIGSWVGQVLGLRTNRVRVLLACGAAAGIGSTFNAPIAGVLFALEVILGTFSAESFGLVVLSSVTATAVSRAALGDAPAFALHRIFSLHSYAELPIYMLLGLLSGLVAIYYVRSVYFFEDLFDNWNVSATLKALVGGLLFGLLGWLGMRYLGGPHLFGVGYKAIEQTLYITKQSYIDFGLGVGFSFTALILLAFFKIIATSLTLGAGGSGGVFAPALFIGGMLGAAFGMLANVVFPDITGPPGAYALVAMGAVFAASAHAPITAVLILFEMTSDYVIILPLMTAVVIAYFLSSSLQVDSIYSIKLRRSGGLNSGADESSTLDLILVADAMSRDCQVMAPDTPVADMIKDFYQGHIRARAIEDASGRLLGIVTRFDVENALMDDRLDEAVAADIMTKNLITCTPDEKLIEVAKRITDQDVGQIFVVDKHDPHKLLGVVLRREIMWIHHEMANEHQRLLHKKGMDLPDDENDSVQFKLEITPQHPELCDKKIRDIKVPDQALIVILRRADRSVIPRGDTIVEPGDSLVFLTTRANEKELKDWIRSKSS